MLSHLYTAYVHVREIVAIKENEVLAMERYSEQQDINDENETAGTSSKGLGKSIPILNLKDVRKKQFALWDAAEEGDVTVLLKLLNEAVIDVNGKGVDQWTALHLAVHGNHPNVVKALLQRGAFVNARTRDRMTPLHVRP